MNTILLEYIKDLQFRNIRKYHFKRMLLKHKPELYEYLKQKTEFLPEAAGVSERLYCIQNNITHRPVCDECKTGFVSFDSVNEKYRSFCSTRCTSSNSQTIAIRKQTCLEKYGVEHAMQSEKFKEKSKQTCLEKYGVEYSFQSDNNKEKAKQTCLEKYSVEHAMQSEKFKEKSKQTCLEKYGVEYSFQSDNNKEKAKQTWLEKYGVDHIGSSPKIRQKIVNTNLQKYGVAMPLQNIDIFNKTQVTRAHNRYNDFLNNKFVTPLFTEEEFNLHKTKSLSWQCKKCNMIFNDNLDFNFAGRQGAIVRCPSCFPKLGGTSNQEKELSDFVSALILAEIKTNDRKTIRPLELDIYIPSKQLAIEFDGLYWHRDRTTVNRNYHLNKTEFCEEQNIHLIHIFENEWLYKQDIVKSRIKNLLGIYDRTVGARLCQIKEVNDKTSKQFIDENHIQGQAISKVNLGLFYQDELVSLMTFSKPRFSKQYDWELVRFCNKLGYHIPGAAGKLLSYFEKSYSPKSLVSYADRRWSYSKKNVYQALDFSLSHSSAPNYWYWKGIEFSSRIKYQKHKLAALLETFDPELSEIQNMMANGYNRIFDCGNLVYIKHYAV